MKALFLIRRFLTVFSFAVLAQPFSALCMTMQDAIPGSGDSVSITSLNDLPPVHAVVQKLERISDPVELQDTLVKENLHGHSLQWHTMFTKVPSDWILFATRTFRAEQLPVIVGIVGVTGALYLVDHNTYSNTHQFETGSRHFRSITDAFISAGDAGYQLGFVGSFAVYGLVANDSRALRTASEMTEAIIATGIVVQVLKRVAGRESPIVATEDRGAIHPFPNLMEYQRHQPRYYSFPSGHIATTTTTLTVLCENFPEAKWLRPASYILIGAVGGSLVSKGWHWYSDLPLGIALGYSFGLIAAHPEGFDVARSGDDKSLGVSVAPRLASRGPEVEMIVHF